MDFNLFFKNIEKYSLKIGVGGILGAFVYDFIKMFID